MKDCLWRDVQSQGTNMSIWLPVLAQEEANPTLRPEKQGRCYHSIQVTGKPLTRAMVTWPCWVSSSNAVLRQHQLSVPNSVSCWHLPIHPNQKSAFVGDACRSGSPWGSVPLLPTPCQTPVQQGEDWIGLEEEKAEPVTNNANEGRVYRDGYHTGRNSIRRFLP